MERKWTDICKEKSKLPEIKPNVNMHSFRCPRLHVCDLTRLYMCMSKHEYTCVCRYTNIHVYVDTRLYMCMWIHGYTCVWWYTAIHEYAQLHTPILVYSCTQPYTTIHGYDFMQLCTSVNNYTRIYMSTLDAYVIKCVCVTDPIFIYNKDAFNTIRKAKKQKN
jgi:hypothetical protein